MNKEITLIKVTIATIIAILICTIIYCMFFSQRGIVTTIGKTKVIVENCYKNEEETLLKYEEYIDSFIPNKPNDKINLGYLEN